MTVTERRFHNEYGEEWVVEYNSDTNKLIIMGDDNEWQRVPLDRHFGTPFDSWLLDKYEQEMVYSLIEELTGSFPLDIRSSYELLKIHRYVDIPFTKEEWNKKVEKLPNPERYKSQTWLKIFKYWSEHPLSQHLYLPNKASLSSKTTYEFPCMACGTTEFILERAHIKPQRLGGTNKLENLHALCYYCHYASENLSGGMYWLFITQRRTIDSALQHFNKPWGSVIKKRKDGTRGRKQTPQTDSRVYPKNWLRMSMDIRARDGKELDDWFLFAGEHKPDHVPLEEWQKQLEAEEE